MNSAPWSKAGLTVFLTAVLLVGTAAPQSLTVRVGTYTNPPKISLGAHDRPQGIFIDILEHIARIEGWELIFVPGTWEQGLSRLGADSIDIMPDMAYTEDRSKLYDFNQITVLSSWLQVYCLPGISFESIGDLANRTIAVLNGSMQQQVLDTICAHNDITCTPLVLPDYPATIEAVRNGRADAVIVSRFYAYVQNAPADALVPTPLILSPSTLHYAAARGRNGHLLSIIDSHMAQMLNDPHSTYYRTLSDWLAEKPRTFIPRWVLWFVAAATALCALFAVVSLILRTEVHKRTRQLQINNDELTQALLELKNAQDEALKRERLYAIGQLASGVAHDLNNLLHPVLFYSELMTTDRESLDNKEAVLRNLNAIRSAAEHGCELIKRMQDFYRSTRDLQDTEILDTGNLVRDVIDLARSRWSGRENTGRAKVDVTLDLDDGVVLAGRASELHEMLLNLVLNAADAMPTGGHLTISTAIHEGSVIISVKDTGTGMDPDVCRRCTEPFFTTKGARGTGMGLSMVQNIVTEHHGHLTIDSVSGTGTTITLTFPIPRNEEPPAA